MKDPELIDSQTVHCRKLLGSDHRLNGGHLRSFTARKTRSKKARFNLRYTFQRLPKPPTLLVQRSQAKCLDDVVDLFRYIGHSSLSVLQLSDEKKGVTSG